MTVSARFRQTRALPVVLCAVLALFTAACGSAPEETAGETRSITISFPTRSAASWPLFIAKEGGYYEKYSLDVELAFAVHPAGIAMVNSGEAAMTNYSLETAMQASARDGSLSIYGSPLNKAVFALIANPQIADVEALRGKRIAISQIGDAPSNYATALISKYGLTSRDVSWIPIGSDANGRAAALVSGRAEATMLTAPQYFKLEDEGYRTVANLADHDDIFASTTYFMSKAYVEANPDLPELLIKAHAEAIKRFYEDREFAVQSYQVYDPQPAQDIERFYDIHLNGNLFERVPYVMAGAIQSVIAQQSDAQMAALMRDFDFGQVVDNSIIDRLVDEGYFEELFGEGIREEAARKRAAAFR